MDFAQTALRLYEQGHPQFANSGSLNDFKYDVEQLMQKGLLTSATEAQILEAANRIKNAFDKERARQGLDFASKWDAANADTRATFLRTAKFTYTEPLVGLSFASLPKTVKEALPSNWSGGKFASKEQVQQVRELWEKHTDRGQPGAMGSDRLIAFIAGETGLDEGEVLTMLLRWEHARADEYQRRAEEHRKTGLSAKFSVEAAKTWWAELQSPDARRAVLGVAISWDVMTDEQREKVISAYKKTNPVADTFSVTATAAKFSADEFPVEVAYRIPGKQPARKVIKDQQAMDKLLEKIAEEGGEVLGIAKGEFKAKFSVDAGGAQPAWDNASAQGKKNWAQASGVLQQAGVSISGFDYGLKWKDLPPNIQDGLKAYFHKLPDSFHEEFSAKFAVLGPAKLAELWNGLTPEQQANVLEKARVRSSLPVQWKELMTRSDVNESIQLIDALKRAAGVEMLFTAEGISAQMKVREKASPKLAAKFASEELNRMWAQAPQEDRARLLDRAGLPERYADMELRAVPEPDRSEIVKRMRAFGWEAYAAKYDATPVTERIKLFGKLGYPTHMARAFAARKFEALSEDVKKEFGGFFDEDEEEEDLSNPAVIWERMSHNERDTAMKKAGLPHGPNTAWRQLRPEEQKRLTPHIIPGGVGFSAKKFASAQEIWGYAKRGAKREALEQAVQDKDVLSNIETLLMLPWEQLAPEVRTALETYWNKKLSAKKFASAKFSGLNEPTARRVWARLDGDTKEHVLERAGVQDYMDESHNYPWDEFHPTDKNKLQHALEDMNLYSAKFSAKFISAESDAKAKNKWNNATPEQRVDWARGFATPSDYATVRWEDIPSGVRGQLAPALGFAAHSDLTDVPQNDGDKEINEVAAGGFAATAHIAEVWRHLDPEQKAALYKKAGFNESSDLPWQDLALTVKEKLVQAWEGQNGWEGFSAKAAAGGFAAEGYELTEEGGYEDGREAISNGETLEQALKSMGWPAGSKKPTKEMQQEWEQGVRRAYEEGGMKATVSAGLATARGLKAGATEAWASLPEEKRMNMLHNSGMFDRAAPGAQKMLEKYVRSEWNDLPLDVQDRLRLRLNYSAAKFNNAEAGAKFKSQAQVGVEWDSMRPQDRKQALMDHFGEPSWRADELSKTAWADLDAEWRRDITSARNATLRGEFSAKFNNVEAAAEDWANMKKAARVHWLTRELKVSPDEAETLATQAWNDLPEEVRAAAAVNMKVWLGAKFNAASTHWDEMSTDQKQSDAQALGWDEAAAAKPWAELTPEQQQAYEKHYESENKFDASDKAFDQARADGATEDEAQRAAEAVMQVERDANPERFSSTTQSVWDSLDYETRKSFLQNSMMMTDRNAATYAQYAWADLPQELQEKISVESTREGFSAKFKSYGSPDALIAEIEEWINGEPWWEDAKRAIKEGGSTTTKEAIMDARYAGQKAADGVAWALKMAETGGDAPGGFKAQTIKYLTALKDAGAEPKLVVEIGERLGTNLHDRITESKFRAAVKGTKYASIALPFIPKAAAPATAKYSSSLTKEKLAAKFSSSDRETARANWGYMSKAARKKWLVSEFKYPEEEAAEMSVHEWEQLDTAQQSALARNVAAFSAKFAGKTEEAWENASVVERKRWFNEADLLGTMHEKYLSWDWDLLTAYVKEMLRRSAARAGFSAKFAAPKVGDTVELIGDEENTGKVIQILPDGQLRVEYPDGKQIDAPVKEWFVVDENTPPMRPAYKAKFGSMTSHVSKAAEAAYKRLSPQDRARLLHRVGADLREDIEEFKNDDITLWNKYTQKAIAAAMNEEVDSEGSFTATYHTDKGKETAKFKTAEEAVKFLADNKLTKNPSKVLHRLQQTGKWSSVGASVEKIGKKLQATDEHKAAWKRLSSKQRELILHGIRGYIADLGAQDSAQAGFWPTNVALQSILSDMFDNGPHEVQRFVDLGKKRGSGHETDFKASQRKH